MCDLLLRRDGGLRADQAFIDYTFIHFYGL